MVRGPEDQFAFKIEKIRSEDGFEGGSVIIKDQDDGTGSEYGPYAYLVSPPSHGREWFYLGKYSEEIDIEERAKMDYKRLLFRRQEIGGRWDWEIGDPLSKSNKEILAGERDVDLEFPERGVYGMQFDEVRKAKQNSEAYQQAWIDTLFHRGSFGYVNKLQKQLLKKLLEELEEEINELHLEDGQELYGPDLDLMFEKREEWDKIPSDYDRFQEAVELGEEPTFIN